MKDLPADVRVGDVIDGKYRIERVVGSGGMGVVVAAEHLRLGKLVALKFLHKDACENREAVTRFLREGQALASITSAHVARVMDVGTLEQGAPYIVMEYLDGADLGAVLKRDGAFGVADATRYVLHVCEAVAEAHAKGIVHRDLKPSNLFLTRGADGVPLVKVLDFGISKAVVQQPNAAAPAGNPDAETAPPQYVTNTGALVGSPLYMSPEQIRNARRVDERTDIWALGVILYELVCGSLPFEGETLAGTLAAVSADPPRALRSLRPDVPEGLELVILRCLEKSPQKRFPTIAALGRALEPFAPPDARASVERISRLLGVRALSPNVAEPTSTADESAPTVPSWEGKTVPPSGFTPRVRRRMLVALSLGAALALGVWFVTGLQAEPPTAPTTAVSFDAAPVALTPSGVALSENTVSPVPSSAPASLLAAPTTSDAAAGAASAPPAASSAPARKAAEKKPDAASKRRPAPTQRSPGPAPQPKEADGTEDRK